MEPSLRRYLEQSLHALQAALNLLAEERDLVSHFQQGDCFRAAGKEVLAFNLSCHQLMRQVIGGMGDGCHLCV